MSCVQEIIIVFNFQRKNVCNSQSKELMGQRTETPQTISICRRSKINKSIYMHYMNNVQYRDGIIWSRFLKSNKICRDLKCQLTIKGTFA